MSNTNLVEMIKSTSPNNRFTKSCGGSDELLRRRFSL